MRSRRARSSTSRYRIKQNGKHCCTQCYLPMLSLKRVTLSVNHFEVGGKRRIGMHAIFHIFEEAVSALDLMTFLVVSLYVPLCQRVRIISNRFVIM